MFQSSVSDEALTIEQAVHGAAHKTESLLESELGKLDKHQRVMGRPVSHRPDNLC